MVPGVVVTCQDGSPLHADIDGLVVGRHVQGGEDDALVAAGRCERARIGVIGVADLVGHAGIGDDLARGSLQVVP